MRPKRPLDPRFAEVTLEPARAGVTSTARVVVVNDGSATWRSRDSEGLQVAYHWLDPLGNAIVWDGSRAAFPIAISPGDSVTVELPVLAPRAPGRYKLAVDLVEEHRFWLEEVGCKPATVDVEIAPRIVSRRLGVVVIGGPEPVTTKALEAQDEPLAPDGATDAVAYLVAGAAPDPTWARRVLDAHAEGYDAVGVAIGSGSGRLPARLRSRRELAAWSPGSRNPRFTLPLLLPSLLSGLEPAEHLGLPAYLGSEGLFEGRATITLPKRSGRRPG